jgi:anaerobic selenocysteine-containing dehydrogenase
MSEAGLDTLAGYTPPFEAAQRGTPLAARYPLALIAGADHYFLNSVFANVTAQTRRSGPGTIRVHPEEQAPGPRVRLRGRVFNDRGAFVAPWRCAGPSGTGRQPKGRWPGLSKDGATVNATVDERDSDMGGGAVFHDNRVEIERLAP